jgi:hypothetical protein
MDMVRTKASLARMIGITLLVAAPHVAAADCVEMGDTGLSLTVQGSYTVQEMDGKVALTFGANTRAPSTITLDMNAEGVRTSETAVLENGMSLAYRTETGEAVGSGGAETVLEGIISSEPTVKVTCAMQGENPDAAWCIPVLGKLRPMADGC